MIIILDILVIIVITVFSIYNSFNSKLIDEIIKLTSLVASVLLTNITPFYKILNQLLTHQAKSIFNTTKIFNADIFNAISFIATFVILYFIILSISNTLKKYTKDFYKVKSDFFQKIVIALFSTIRMTIIVTLLIYGLESSIFYAESVQKKLHTSPSLRAFSYFSNSIIND